MILVCLIAIVVAYFVFIYNKMNHGKSLFVITTAAVLFIYSALRGHSEGTDIASYISKFEGYLEYSFLDMLSLFKTGMKSPFFHLIGWFFGKLIPNGQAWIAFIALIYVAAVSVVVYKESRDPALTFIMFITLGFFLFSLSGLRQTMAMAFTALAFLPLKNRKLIPFIVLVILASLFHSSAIIFLIIYPLATRKMGWLQVAIFVIATVMFVGFEDVVRRLIEIVFEDSYLAGYADKEAGLSILGFLVQAAIFAFSLISYKSVTDKYKGATVLYNCSFLGLTIQMYSSMIAEVFRASMYFSVFNILLVPLVMECEKNKKIMIAETVLIPFILIVYFFRNGIPEYTFFWG